MLLKYLLPVAALVALQLFFNSNSVEAQADGDKEDLESAELFLRPVVIKYGHSHPGVYTWQGGSGVGTGWGMYQPKAPAPAAGGGWGEKKKKEKKKKKKKEKKKKPKKKKEKKKKKKKEKKKKEKKGGWGWSWGWIEDGGGSQGNGGYGSPDSKESGERGGGDDGEGKESGEDEKGRLNLQPVVVKLPSVKPNEPPSHNIVARFGTPAGFRSSEDYMDFEPFDYPNVYNNY